jgi:hypothetical protein
VRENVIVDVIVVVIVIAHVIVDVHVHVNANVIVIGSPLDDLRVDLLGQHGNDALEQLDPRPR